MKKEKIVWAIMVLAMLPPLHGNAQQDSLKTFSLDEVVITATKFPKSSSETGKVLTVIDADQLQRSEGKDLAQLLNEQVGLIINGSNSNPGKDKSVYLRGAKSEYTLFLIDGIPVSDPSGAGGAFDLRMLPLAQLERIEILKGSQSTLYGSDAIAGVINLITKKNGDKSIGGNATVSYGSYDLLRATGSINGSLDAAEYNVGYSYVNSIGISEAEDTSNTGTFDKDGFSQNAFNASVKLKVNQEFSITPFLRYTEYDGQFDGGSFTDDNSTYTSKLFNPGLSSQYKLKKGAINFIYGRNSTDRNFDGPFGPSEFKGRFDNADAFINSDITDRLQILGGFNYQKLEMLDATLTIIDPEAVLLSPYVSVFLHNMNGFALEFGGRHNNHSRYGNNATYSFNPSYTLNKSIKIFINQSSGFKAPTLSQLYGSFGANEDLKPETSNSSEAGIQVIVNNNIDLRISSFKRNVKNIIVYTFSNGNINLDEQNDFGFEIEPSVKLNDKLTIRANYSFVDGEVTTKENGKDSTYFNLFRRPKHSFGINLSIQSNPRLYFNVNLKTFSARKDLFFNPNNFFITEIVRLESYVLVDAYAAYKILDNRINIFIDAKNILNQDYREVYGYNTLGFNLNAGLSFNF